jgi:hypothetical protein
MDTWYLTEDSKCSVCGYISKSHFNRHLVRCKKQVEFLNKYNLTPENIEIEYNNLGSVLAFQEKYPFHKDFQFYYALFKTYNIPRSLKHAANHPKVKQKRQHTLIDKTGLPHNFCKNAPSRLLWEEKLLKEEGITNVFQRKEVIQKIKKTLLSKYGTELWRHNLLMRGKNSISKLNLLIYSILKDNNIQFEVELKLDNPIGLYYAYDVLIIPNKIIEINGDYWHGNPSLYKPDDIILKGSSKEMLVKDKWAYDKIKLDVAENAGYKTLVVWESELIYDYENTIKKILKYAAS